MIKRILSFLPAFCLAAGALASPAQAQTAAKELFGRMQLPTVGNATPLGFYSKGCIDGAVALPIDGPNWQVMRLERNRRWGHPELVALIERLSRDVAGRGWPGLLVGDMSQPRGGPMLSGHASHQIGLDADIWLKPMPNRRLSAAERADMDFESVLKPNSLEVDPRKWSPAHEALLYTAASYREVQRIFVHPGIKKVMCERYGDNSANDAWMNKLRPYWGHHEHMHIRLFCPDGASGCKPQQSTGSGNGCGDQLAWWFTDEPWKPADPNAPKAKPKVTTVSDLPNACRAVLSGPAPADASLVTYSQGYDPSLAEATAVAASPPQPGSNRMKLPAKIPLPVPRPAR